MTRPAQKRLSRHHLDPKYSRSRVCRHWHTEPLARLEALHIRIAEGYFWTPYLPFTNMAVLPVLQLAFIFLAAILFMILLWKIWIQIKQQKVELNPWGWRILIGICSFYLLIAVLLSILWKTIQQWVLNGLTFIPAKTYSCKINERLIYLWMLIYIHHIATFLMHPAEPKPELTLL